MKKIFILLSFLALFAVSCTSSDNQNEDAAELEAIQEEIEQIDSLNTELEVTQEAIDQSTEDVENALDALEEEI